MNTSFDDQASQSTNEQQSEISSANLQSPLSSSAPNTTSHGNQHLTPQQQHHHHQQQQKQQSAQNQQHYHNQESYLYSNSASNYHHDIRNLTAQQRPALSIPIPARRAAYTGVDKLIMAAMMEDSAAAAAALAAATGASGYMPSGRGIGYFGSARDTYAQIPTPSNKSELELYRLLERANLVNYFGTFLNFGGDDVQQLSDADEDEFLEIMSLVGMTQKPLHVRRLQKALIEWRDNKELENSFRRPLNSTTSNRQIINPSMESMTQTPTSSSRNITTSNDNQNQQYVLPHEILIGAPKRLRLMDNLHKRHNNQDHPISKSNSAPLQQNNQQSNAVDNSSERLTSSPKSLKGIDKEDDKLIEIMDSSQSDLELEDDTTRAVCGSPKSTKFSHSKFGRYRASLQASPNKLNS